MAAGAWQFPNYLEAKYRADGSVYWWCLCCWNECPSLDGLTQAQIGAQDIEDDQHISSNKHLKRVRWQGATYHYHT